MRATRRPAKRIFIYLVIAAAVTFAILLFCYNPAKTAVFPPCPSKFITGYDCPGCGSLRGLHALMHGDVAAAWGFNPAIFVALALIIFIFFANMHRNRLFETRLAPGLRRWSAKAARVTDHPFFPIAVLIAIVVWTVLRNLN